MALTPQERSDFDAIVARLRIEDTVMATPRARREGRSSLPKVLLAVLALAVGVALTGQQPGVVGPLLVLVAMLGGLAVALRLLCLRVSR
jgi:xanthine/uracil permease